MAVHMPALPYAQDALEGFLSANTLSFHYGKHLKNYVDTTNKLIAGTADESKSLTDIIKTAKGPLFNNAAQVFNHQFYFESISPKSTSVPPEVLAIIEHSFGSLDEFLSKFKAAAAGNFGSGWTWLVKKGGTLSIVSTSNAGCPITDGFTPLLTVDVWEHAYYLDYQNRRADYLAKFCEHIDWAKVAERLV